MLLAKENARSTVKFNKEAPHVGTPYVENSKEPSPFYRNDPEANQVIAGYRKGPRKSYTKELAKKFPLTGK
ncbi:MAG: hypothetical protein K2N00_06495 [Lachnospiraceae bacterium]|nr:hypothetical protein [Lachnospiraceae bacterium]